MSHTYAQNVIHVVFSTKERRRLIEWLNIPKVVRYIQNQGSYHKKMKFEQEFLAFLRKHGVEFDPKYVFG